VPLPVQPAVEDGFTPLFNGRDLAGWTGDIKGYKVEDGKISVGGQTYTRDELRDQIERERKGVNAQNIPGKNARPGEGKLTIGDKTFTRDELRGNIYKREDNPLRTAELSRGRSLQAPKVANGVENNIFADRNGDIYRLKDNWEQYGKDGWSKSFAPSAGKESHELARPASSSVQRSEVAGRDITQIHGWSRPAVSDIPEREISSPERDSARGDLDRQNWARQRGEERVNDFQRNFPNGGTFAGGRERQGSEGRHHDFNGSHQSFGGGRPSFESRGHGSRGGGGSHGGGFHGGGGGRR